MQIFKYISGTSLLFYSVYKVHQCCMISNKKKLNRKLKLFKRLPDVLLQNVISFVVYSVNIKLTNKRFYQLSEKNKKIELIKAAKLNKQHRFMPDMKHLFAGNKWIVDANREHLTINEKQSGFESLFGDIITGITHCNHGDTLVIYKGRYVFTEYELEDWTSKWIMIIGIGKVVIENIPFPLLTNIHFENIHFDFADTNKWMVTKQLSMKNCVWNRVPLECVGNAYFEDCVFNKTSLHLAGKWENVVIIGCTFSNLYSCIDIISTRRRSRSIRKLIIIGNTFKCENDHPIISHDRNVENVLIKHNILKVSNTFIVNQGECVNPNKIHNRNHCNQ